VVRRTVTLSAVAQRNKRPHCNWLEQFQIAESAWLMVMLLWPVAGRRLAGSGRSAALRIAAGLELVQNGARHGQTGTPCSIRRWRQDACWVTVDDRCWLLFRPLSGLDGLALCASNLQASTERIEAWKRTVS
jgi:hypothetical protein